MKHLRFGVLLTAATFALAGCTVGPKYKRPVVDTPQIYRGAEQTDTTQTSVPPQSENGGQLPNTAAAIAQSALSIGDEKWWQVFSDPELQTLIHTAIKQNYNIRIAAQRVLEAQAQLGVTRSNEFPQFSGGANYTQTRYPSAQFGGLGSFITHLGELTLNASWNLDFWGQYRKATEAARAQLLANQWSQREVLDTLILNVATGYFQLRTLDLQLEIAQRTLKSRQESLQLTQTLEAGGSTSLLDVRQAEQLVYTAAAQIPDLERQIEQEENAIQTLLGQNPGPIKRGLNIADQPHMPTVPAGLPSDLIERRPDIRQAEEQLVAANAQIGVAKAAYFPQISLTGQVGTGSNALNRLFTAPGFLYSFGPSSTVPIFTAGRLRNNLRLTEAQQQEQLFTYKQTVAQAFQDVSNALVGYQKYREFREQEEKLTSSARDASDLSNLRYRGGVTSYLEVLTNETNYFSAQLSLAGARENEALSLVRLYNALGGGWQQ